MYKSLDKGKIKMENKEWNETCCKYKNIEYFVLYYRTDYCEKSAELSCNLKKPK